MGIVGKLREHQRIMVDTAPIIYFIEEHSRFGKIADDLFKAVTPDKTRHMFSSVIALIEVLIRPLRESDPELAEKYRYFFLHATNFTLALFVSPIRNWPRSIGTSFSTQPISPCIMWTQSLP